MPFASGAVAGVACAAAAGASLGAVLGPLAFVPLLVAPFVAGREHRIEKGVVALAVSTGLMIGPLAVLHRFSGAILSWGLLVAAGSLAVAGVVAGLRRLGLAPVFASAGTIALSVLWLAWPVWLSPHLTSAAGDQLAGWLIPVHPIFATNALFTKLGIWTEMGTAYRLTNLNQDIPYALPAGPWACMVVNGVLGALLLLPTPNTPSRE